ncbi:Pyruvate decarboxylase isozyme 1 [Symbiodinium microadriaticum]|uniref:Pyruvate decarboxylase isozyme 1 n=1 Tax=Symbiodinium microadriaticum TaxID=2951 RepID=A0A1Q9E8D7_SYMMI|nr:Pyruvate decarboxylase isozyme 1 [Symbiodinium microadriaticum]
MLQEASLKQRIAEVEAREKALLQRIASLEKDNREMAESWSKMIVTTERESGFRHVELELRKRESSLSVRIDELLAEQEDREATLAEMRSRALNDYGGEAHVAARLDALTREQNEEKQALLAKVKDAEERLLQERARHEEVENLGGILLHDLGKRLDWATEPLACTGTSPAGVRKGRWGRDQKVSRNDWGEDGLKRLKRLRHSSELQVRGFAEKWDMPIEQALWRIEKAGLVSWAHGCVMDIFERLTTEQQKLVMRRIPLKTTGFDAERRFHYDERTANQSTVSAQLRRLGLGKEQEQEPEWRQEQEQNQEQDEEQCDQIASDGWVYPIHVAARLADVEAMFVNGCPSLTDIMRNWANLKFVYEGLRQKSGGSGCARAGLSNGMDFTKVISDGYASGESTCSTDTGVCCCLAWRLPKSAQASIRKEQLRSLHLEIASFRELVGATQIEVSATAGALQCKDSRHLAISAEDVALRLGQLRRLNYQPPSSDEQALRKVVEQVAHAVNSAGKVGVLVGVFVDRDGLQQVVEDMLTTSRLLPRGVSPQPVLDATEGADILLTLGMPRTEFNLGFLTHDFKEDRMIELGHDTANVMGEEVHGVYLRHLLPLLAQKISPRAEEVFEDTFPFTYTKQREVPENRPLTVDFMYPQLAHFVQEGDIVTGNTGGYINMSRMRLKKGNTTVGPTNWASLGSVFPISIGMAFAAPERRIVCLDGDGSFQMTGSELCTLLRHNLNFLLIILNNAGYTAERAIHPDRDDSYNDIHVWNYHLLPQALGGRPDSNGVDAHTEAQFVDALSSYCGKGLQVVNARLDKNDMPSFFIEMSEEGLCGALCGDVQMARDEIALASDPAIELIVGMHTGGLDIVHLPGGQYLEANTGN